MTSLSEKRASAYHHSLHSSGHNSNLGQLNLNTDELETKMDTIISTISNNEFKGVASASVTGGTTNTLIPTVDLGSASSPHKINIVGTTTDSNIDCILQVSNDNITYYDLPQFIITVVGTKFSGIGDTCFRYIKLNVTNNTGSPVTVALEYCIKNI